MNIMFNLNDIITIILFAILVICGLILLGDFLWRRLKNKFKKAQTLESEDKE